LRRISFPAGGLFTVAALLIASAAVLLWREAARDAGSARRIATAEEFASSCRTAAPECAEAVKNAMRWEVSGRGLSRLCLSRRPGADTMAVRIAIWLDAHDETRALPLDRAVADAAEALWPCRQ
jgi:hypothetical protein